MLAVFKEMYEFTSREERKIATEYFGKYLPIPSLDQSKKLIVIGPTGRSEMASEVQAILDMGIKSPIIGIDSRFPDKLNMAELKKQGGDFLVGDAWDLWLYSQANIQINDIGFVVGRNLASENTHQQWYGRKYGNSDAIDVTTSLVAHNVRFNFSTQTITEAINLGFPFVPNVSFSVNSDTSNSLKSLDERELEEYLKQTDLLHLLDEYPIKSLCYTARDRYIISSDY